jgi:cytochrome c
MKTTVLALTWILMTLPGGCRGGNPASPAEYRVETIGDAERGRELIERSACGTCHTIPGVPRAQGRLASPLFWYSRRSFIAGEIPNTPLNLAQWVRDPRAIEPRTAMPSLGLDQREARDVAAYLFTLR